LDILEENNREKFLSACHLLPYVCWRVSAIIEEVDCAEGYFLGSIGVKRKGDERL